MLSFLWRGLLFFLAPVLCKAKIAFRSAHFYYSGKNLNLALFVLKRGNSRGLSNIGKEHLIADPERGRNNIIRLVRKRRRDRICDIVKFAETLFEKLLCPACGFGLVLCFCALFFEFLKLVNKRVCAALCLLNNPLCLLLSLFKLLFAKLFNAVLILLSVRLGLCRLNANGFRLVPLCLIVLAAFFKRFNNVLKACILA